MLIMFILVKTEKLMIFFLLSAALSFVGFLGNLPLIKLPISLASSSSMHISCNAGHELG